MKRLFACTGLLALAATLSAQTPAAQAPPASPAESTTATIGGKTVTVAYGAPSVKGRAGTLFTKDGRISKDPTSPVWRAGANSATKMRVEGGSVKIGPLSVPAGDYTLYVDISNPDAWNLVVSKQTGQWGTKYDKSMDLGRVPMQTSAPPAMVETLKYTLVDNGGGQGSLTLAWENKSASVPISAH